MLPLFFLIWCFLTFCGPQDKNFTTTYSYGYNTNKLVLLWKHFLIATYEEYQ
jgi:hypothetical protein